MMCEVRVAAAEPHAPPAAWQAWLHAICVTWPATLRRDSRISHPLHCRHALVVDRHATAALGDEGCTSRGLALTHRCGVVPERGTFTHLRSQVVGRTVARPEYSCIREREKSCAAAGQTRRCACTSGTVVQELGAIPVYVLLMCCIMLHAPHFMHRAHTTHQFCTRTSVSLTRHSTHTTLTL